MAVAHVNIINDMLRGEISAVEELEEIKAEHVDFCNMLRRKVHREGSQPETDSGVWGAWAKTVEGTAKVFGKKAALKALKEGEEHGLRMYQDALEDHRDQLDAELAETLESEYIPATRQHVQSLDQLMEGAE